MGGKVKDVFNVFEPLMRWEELSVEERLDFYDRHVSNEANYFMLRKVNFFNIKLSLRTWSKLVQRITEKCKQYI